MSIMNKEGVGAVERLLRRGRRLHNWFTKHHVEKPCGCEHWVDSRPLLPKQAPETDVVDGGVRTVSTKEYVNATVYKQEFWARLRCTECDAVYEQTRKAGRKTDYGEKNPDAGRKLRVDHHPGPKGGRWVHTDEPVVMERDG